MNILSAKFVKSASKLSECLESELSEVAFIGRSNVGKSSIINMLAQRNNLARQSVTPGKTQLINFFVINDQRHLVDLPGYGYAKVGKGSRKLWLDMIQEYMTKRTQLKHVFVLVDASIPPQQIDLDFVGLLYAEKIPFSIVHNKVDKTTQKEVAKNIKQFKQLLGDAGVLVNSFFQASALKKRGAKQILEFCEKTIFAGG